MCVCRKARYDRCIKKAKALVENAMEHAAQQAEDEKIVLKTKVRGALPSLLKIFHAIDKDNSGMVTRDELHNVPMGILPPKILAAVCVDNWEELFEYLDVDGTGSLSQARTFHVSSVVLSCFIHLATQLSLAFMSFRFIYIHYTSILFCVYELKQVEFVEGLLNLCLLDMPIATIQTLKLLQLIRTSLRQIQSRLPLEAKLSECWT